MTRWNSPTRPAQWIAPLPISAAHADDDGIVCLPAVRGEKPAHERLLALLIDAWETVTPGSWKAFHSRQTARRRRLRRQEHWTSGCARSSSNSTPSASTTVPSSGMSGTA
jgi:hypothetical protein